MKNEIHKILIPTFYTDAPVLDFHSIARLIQMEHLFAQLLVLSEQLLTYKIVHIDNLKGQNQKKITCILSSIIFKQNISFSLVFPAIMFTFNVI